MDWNAKIAFDNNIPAKVSGCTVALFNNSCYFKSGNKLLYFMSKGGKGSFEVWHV